MEGHTPTDANEREENVAGPVQVPHKIVLNQQEEAKEETKDVCSPGDQSQCSSFGADLRNDDLISI